MGEKVKIYQHSQAAIEDALKRQNLMLKGMSDFFVKIENAHKMKLTAYLAVKAE
jgi:hypothetical protein